MRFTTLPEIKLEYATNWKDYKLLDSGNGKTLEQFGAYRLIRPEPQVIWPKSLPNNEWQKADASVQETKAEFGGQWHFMKPIEKSWKMSYKEVQFQIQLSSSRHVGVFPEQASHWDFIYDQITKSKRKLKILNLFGYTGLATLIAVKAGAHVTHVDSSKHAISWANHNMSLSNLDKNSVRWVVEDALKFIEREGRRGNQYDGIILDPPKFGRGSDGKVWDFFKNISSLLEACNNVLRQDAQFVVLTAYAIQASPVIAWQAMQQIVNKRSGIVETGELISIEESAGHIISHALFSRWSAV